MDSVEPRYKTSIVAAREGVSTRTIYEWVQNNQFPQPDFPASKHGEANYWLESTLVRHREAQIAQLRQRAADRATVLR